MLVALETARRLPCPRPVQGSARTSQSHTATWCRPLLVTLPGPLYYPFLKATHAAVRKGARVKALRPLFDELRYSSIDYSILRWVIPGLRFGPDELLYPRSGLMCQRPASVSCHLGVNSGT